MGLLCEHLTPPAAAGDSGLTAAELGTLTKAFGPLLCQARFLAPLRRAVARQLWGDRPGLATKVAAMSDKQFAQLCERLRRTSNTGG
jgi:hypothetical protein